MAPFAQDPTTSNVLAMQDQLRRILASKTFRRLPRPSELLGLLVEMEFAGTPLDQRELGVRMFNRDPDWITLDDNIVRQNTSRLRKLLETYYDTEGSEDRLVSRSSEPGRSSLRMTATPQSVVCAACASTSPQTAIWL